MKIHDMHLRIKETLRKKFADLANDFEQKIHDISRELTAMEGPLEVSSYQRYLLCIIRLTTMQTQQEQIEHIQTRIPSLVEALSTVEHAEVECIAANVEENDYTIFTCQDLQFELELVVQSITKKITFIDNQVGPSACISSGSSVTQVAYYRLYHET